MLDHIQKKTNVHNKDNISRTVSYADFYKRNPEIRWAMLASMVSRNAGYSMCDLQGDWLPRMLSTDTRKHLFHTYERANWLIFQDAYPQLLLYEYSKQEGIPLFDLLDCFHVSQFMKNEWDRFWREKNVWRLCTSLIINEQHVIEEPVIKQSFYRKRIFAGLPFLLQDYMHFSTVLFPIMRGEVFGISVHGFKKVKNRIETGKTLYWVLFESEWSKEILAFSNHVTHTGSRHDFERFVYPQKQSDTPLLRTVYPVIQHRRNFSKDWFKRGMRLNGYYKKIKPIHEPCLTDWYKQKQRQLKMVILLKEWMQNA
nr:DUF2515 family protein [Fictibacillus nanhaiensis]